EPTASSKSILAARNQALRTRVVGSHRRRPAEDGFVQLANEIPGFAGVFISPQHELVALVKDTTVSRSATALAKSALTVHLSTDGLGMSARVRPSSVRIVAADYDFQTLSDYRDFVSDSVLGRVHGVSMVDLDEEINRVTIATLASVPGVQGKVTQMLVAHNIPLAAIHFVSGRGVRATTGSRARFDRRRGHTSLTDGSPDHLGGGIAFQSAAVGGNCTIGMVVDSASARRLVSASHCTYKRYELDHDSMTTSGGLYIGKETADPVGTQSC